MASGEKDTAEDGPRAEGTSDSRRDPLIGSLVNGKYRVVSAIARGGMGRIYYATQVPLERPVALKVVQGDGDHEHESQFLKRFLQEASILAKLQHPNVVTLFDYGQIEGAHVEQYFIAMEFLAGETLTFRLKNRPRLSVGETLILGRQIARGLREAHKRGIVHRDLKPSNIILVPEGDGSEIVKLVDFGIGKVLGRPGDAQDLTQDGVFVGTPRYMAPEQFEGHAFPASDFYALGTIMFQCLAGRLPFTGSTMSEFMVAKLARGVPLIRELAPDTQVPESVEVLVQHLLARKPEERPTMEELHNHFMICEEEVFGTPHSLRRGNSSGPHTFNQTGSAPHVMGQTGSGPHSTGPRSMGTAVGVGPGWSSPQLPPSPSSHGAMSAAHHVGEGLRVPHTVIAPIPNMAQMTPRPMEAPVDAPYSGQMAAAAPSSSRIIIIAAGLLGACMILGFVVLSRQLHSQGGSPPLDKPADTAASTPAPFTLTIESQPAGATVSEGDKVLGDTPCNVTIERASIAGGPRTFVLKKDGFAPSQVVQGASTDNVHSVVALAPLAPEVPSAVKSRPPASGKPVAQGPPPVKPPATPAGAQTGTAPDIRLKR